MVKSVSVIILVMILLAACTSIPPAATQPEMLTKQPAVAQPTPASAATLSSPTDGPATRVPTLIPTTPLATVEKSSGALWVKITSPLDNSTVSAAEIDVIGTAPVDTVLSINDEIVEVGSDQKFTAHLTLDEGINIIEVLASDLSGNEVFIPLTVYFDK